MWYKKYHYFLDEKWDNMYQISSPRPGRRQTLERQRAKDTAQKPGGSGKPNAEMST